MEPITTKLHIRNGADGAARSATGTFVRFSPYRCFTDHDDDSTRALLDVLAAHLDGLDGPLALYRWGSFLDRLLDRAPRLIDKVAAIIDRRPKDGETCHGRPVVAPDGLPSGLAAIFLCEPRADRRARMRQSLSPHLDDRVRVLCPDILPSLGQEAIPSRAWITFGPSIYPTPLPEMVFPPGLDMILLDLPARMMSLLPTGVAYVHNALKKADVTHKTVDADVLCYHLYHIHRLFDLGAPPTLSNGLQLAENPWAYADFTAWDGTANWPGLRELFADLIDDVAAGVIAARPKILGLSVHSSNQWAARAVAERVKAQAPDIVIMVGGFSCNRPGPARHAVDHWDYLAVAEADHTVGPMVERLAAGEKPKNQPGFISRFDDPDVPFTWAPRPPDLDAIDMVRYDWFDDLPAVYRNFDGSPVGVPVIASRGCRWSQCSFCGERFPWRSRSVENFVDELERMHGMGFRNYVFQESDLNGRPELLMAICREIVRRNLRIQLTGQLRIHAKSDKLFFTTLRAAGFVSLRFGVDAWARNTLKLQRKGYTTQRVSENLRACREAGIQSNVNLVIGVPGETEEDITETIDNLVANGDFITRVANINKLGLINGSLYWDEPEKHGIVFRGDEEEIRRANPTYVPPELWYSTDPYIDDEVRQRRFERIVHAIAEAGIAFSAWAAKANVAPRMGWTVGGAARIDAYGRHRIARVNEHFVAISEDDLAAGSG